MLINVDQLLGHVPGVNRRIYTSTENFGKLLDRTIFMCGHSQMLRYRWMHSRELHDTSWLLINFEIAYSRDRVRAIKFAMGSVDFPRVNRESTDEGGVKFTRRERVL